MRALIGSVLLSILVSACGGAPPPAPAVAEATPPPALVVAQVGVIRRADLDATLDAGLGAFLGRVGTAPSLEDGHFVGFRLTELRDPTLFDGVDLQTGDVVVSVNGQPI